MQLFTRSTTGGSAPSRKLASLLFIMVALLVGMANSPSFAQEGEEAAPAPAAEKDVQAPNNDGEKISYLSWAAGAVGWFYGLIFLGISFILVALFVMNLISGMRSNVIPDDLVDGFEEHLNAKQYQEAYELAKADESFLGHVLSAGIAKVSSGYNESIEAMQEVGEEENMRLEHRLSYLALIGTLSPMIGLLGTVSGMITSFRLIANTATGAPDPQALAQGISTALFTTFIGLAIAIPALAIYNILRNRVSRLSLEVGIVSEGLMSRFQKPARRLSFQNAYQIEIQQRYCRGRSDADDRHDVSVDRLLHAGDQLFRRRARSTRHPPGKRIGHPAGRSLRASAHDPPDRRGRFPLRRQGTHDHRRSAGPTCLGKPDHSAAYQQEPRRCDRHHPADEDARAGLVQEIINTCQDLKFERFALRGKQSDEPTLGKAG